MISIGWISLDKEDKPKRAPGSARFGDQYFGPPKVYTTKKRAETYSPIGQAKEVFIKEETDVLI